MGNKESTNTLPKEKLTLCFIGHVDSGKSTTIGRLALDFGALDPRKLDKLQKEADELGKGSFSLAFFTDRNKAERERGITITTTLIQLQTDRFNLNVIDCPGHKDFIKNMVSGTAQADVAVVIVPSALSEFESALQSGTLKDHIMISGVLGVKKVIIAINKVDTLSDDIRQTRYKNVAEEMVRVVKKLHCDKDPIVIPISGLDGIGISNKGKKFEWFEGFKVKGVERPLFTLEDAIDYQEPAKREINKPLRASINAVMKVAGAGTVLTAQVIQGKATPGLPILIQPAETIGEIKTLEIHRQAVPEVIAGDNFGFVVKITKGDVKNIKAGYVLSHRTDNPVIIYKGARAKIVLVDHPKGVRAGYSPTLDLGVVHVPVKLAKLISKRVKGQKEETPDPDIILKGESFSAVIIPQKDCVMDVMKEIPSLARFALRDGGKVVGIGAIDELYHLSDLINMNLIENQDIKTTSAGKAGEKIAKTAALKKKS